MSDGLLGDLEHVLERSGVGATLEAGPARALLAALHQGLALDDARIDELVFAGGDDYELAFTASPRHRAAVEAAGRNTTTRVTRIGTITAETGLRLLDAQGRPVARRFAGFDHFA